jgi:acetyl/propionyl-CoA carboxylase alpha subunit
MIIFTAYKILIMKKVLVANRGEIAVRVLRTLKEMGIKTVSIYSEADRLAPHVIMADEAVCIGPPPSNQSYLLGGKIIDIAKSLNVDGIHPGYGFLSENAEFSKAVNESGITFIGPSPSSILTMGNKLMAKKAVSSYNIPLVPGTESALKDKNEALEVSKKIGFPLLIKAAAGGGGKGMRVVHNEGEIEEQIQRAINEAESSFGDGRVFIETQTYRSSNISRQSRKYYSSF